MDALSDDSSILSDISSELSSVGSQSPQSPALGYPSPISSQDQDSIEPLFPQDSKKHSLEDDDTPVAKKRKRPEPKQRTTQTLDLSSGMRDIATEQQEELDVLLKVLKKRRKIVVIAGAGISVSAGIPDFRSSTGLFKSLKSDHKLKASGKQLFDASVYSTDSSTSSFHDMVRSLSGMVSAAKPTVFHQMLDTLGSEERLMRLYTQNVDGIDVGLPSLETTVPLRQKGPWPRSVQLHGGLEKMVCSKCHTISDFAPELFNGPEPPPCEACIEADRVRTDHAGKRSHGIGRLRPRMVLYNEHNPDEEAIGTVVSSDLRSRPDALIVVGTSMKIPGVRRIVREMCGVVRGRRDGLTVWINQDGPPPGKEFEDCWDLVVRGPCDEVARQWTMSVNAHNECTSSDVERATEANKVEVVVNKHHANGIMTPSSSPRPKPKLTIKLNMPSKDGKIAADAKKPAQPKDDKPTKTKSNTKMVKKRTYDPQNTKINFKASKPSVKPFGRPPKVKNSDFVSPGPAVSHAMEPLSMSEARNNGPLSRLKSALPKTLVLPNLSRPSVADICITQPIANQVSSSNKFCHDSHTGRSNQTASGNVERPMPINVTGPTTPTNGSRPLSSYRGGTISPKSIPNGMARLLDT